MEVLALNEMDAIISSMPQDDGKQWFVMRDLTRNNAKLPAYRMLDNLKIECFTPMVSKIVTCHGIRERREVPYMHDLLFAHDTREVLDPIVERIPTFQYRYLRRTYRVPMTVRHEDMERFLRAVQSVESLVRRKSLRLCIGIAFESSAAHWMVMKVSCLRCGGPR